MRLKPLVLSCASALVLAAGALAPAAATADALGPPGGTIYAHDVAYRTIGTPENLTDAGQFNHIYTLEGGLASVSDSAPGDPDFRGGRWEVRPVTFVTIAPRQFTNAEDLRAAAARGEVRIGDIVRRFECPLIRER